MAALLALFSALSISSAAVQDDWSDVDCAKADSTLEQNVCAGRDVRALEQNLRFYTDTAYAVLKESDERDSETLIATMHEGERLWRVYVDSACSAVDAYWEPGTIRTVMTANCEMELIRERTHHIWREYLTPMERAPSLAEPPHSSFD